MSERFRRKFVFVIRTRDCGVDPHIYHTLSARFFGCRILCPFLSLCYHLPPPSPFFSPPSLPSTPHPDSPPPLLPFLPLPPPSPLSPPQGAVESILERCSSIQLSNGSVKPLTDESRRAVLGSFEQLASRALRCLAFAVKRGKALGVMERYTGEGHSVHALLQDPANYAGMEKDMTFVGMAGLRVSQGIVWLPLW